MERKNLIQKRVKEFGELSEAKKKEIIEWRLSMLKAYQLIVTSMNNEDAYFSWINGWLPDAATEEDFEDCARDYEQFEEQTQRFKGLMKNYGDDGFVALLGRECVADETVKDYWERVNHNDNKEPEMTEQQKMAIKLHESLCSSKHTDDGCSWYREITDGIHDWTGEAHKNYLKQANEMFFGQGIRYDALTSILKDM